MRSANMSIFHARSIRDGEFVMTLDLERTAYLFFVSFRIFRFDSEVSYYLYVIIKFTRATCTYGGPFLHACVLSLCVLNNFI